MSQEYGMIKADSQTAVGVRWDLDRLYSGIDDPQILLDLERLLTAAESWPRLDRVSERRLEKALAGLIEFRQAADRVWLYFRLLKKVNIGSHPISQTAERTFDILQDLERNAFRFYAQALAELPASTVRPLAARSEIIGRHLPWLEIQRFHRQHSAGQDERVERLARAARQAQAEHRRALHAERFPHPYSSWSKALNLSGIVNLLNNDPSDKTRWRAQRSLNNSLCHPKFAEKAARALRQTIAWRQAECQSRGFASAMEPRNRMNDLSDAAVAALHQSLTRVGPDLLAKHYRTKAHALGLERLAFSDLNCPWGDSDDIKDEIPYAQARQDLIDAVTTFSSGLGTLAARLTKPGRVDAEPRPNKASGANNNSAVLADGPVSFIMVNWHGQERNRVSLAHELGHALRAELAGQRQGPLLSAAPMIMSEAIAMFMEALSFEHRLKQAETDRARQRLCLGARLDRLLEGSLRQVCLSSFEQQLYAEAGQLTPGLISDLWQEQHRRFYGPTDGLFEYRNFSHRWAHLLHLHRPFAVYGYAAAQVVALALLERRHRLGRAFQEPFRELLANGQAKRTGDLLAAAPLNIDLEDSEFWSRVLVSHCRQLYRKLKKAL